ncbi:amylo-alpha-1,6-glucosidase [Pelomonas sp. SE-A7]|uniref:amylo-alpha-1,6-glucosidase n=1 Tax=Pelomonas sp. SE-A7 TaxID=3054953 RepID=UPI00259D1792|nr:amylo-alpha-1,6-glucosidase [Pelomonas sp. SE-A7]MDM4766773.1 amylo-alpha-1,6-glucosidase [Pelomonas sp. SE-A7]
MNKGLLRAATLVACLVVGGSANAKDPRPGVEALFTGMALKVSPDKPRHFVVGDNVDGYLDARTGGHGLGEGYWIGQQILFKDQASYVDGRLLDRASPRAQERVLPYGRELRLGPDQEQLVMHAGSRRLSMQVGSDKAARLAIQPLWKSQPATLRWEGQVLLIQWTDSPLVAALSADQPFEIAADGSALAAGMPLLQAKEKSRRFTLHLAIAADEASALAQARAMSGSDQVIAQSLASLHERLTRSWLSTGDASYDQALLWAKASALGFLVDEYGRGLWAGLPWFRENWGRDTFIALPGTLLVSGHFESAREVLDNFARYQNLEPPKDGDAKDPVAGQRASHYGRIPNRVRGEEKIYNTVDGTPWMLREGLEYVRYSGDTGFAEQLLKLAKPYIDGALKHSVDADGLLVHDDADTWMDARIEGREPWSARGPRAVEIQALWITALEAAAELAEWQGKSLELAKAWRSHAARARQSLLRLFWDGRAMADRLRADGSRDLKLRPNQLMLVSVPLDPLQPIVPLDVEARMLRSSVNGLLFPYGIASLDPTSDYFHPHHVNDTYHHKDAAYHNGTIWGWNAGFAITALNKFGQQDLAWQLSRNLAEQVLGRNVDGTLGTMSELLDALPGADGRPGPSGTFAQSWSVAEFERNGFQDFLGFRPDLLRGELRFSPALPQAWRRFDAVLPFGRGASLQVQGQRERHGWRWTLRSLGTGQVQKLAFDVLDARGGRQRLSFQLPPERPVVLRMAGTKASLDGKPLKQQPVQASQQALLQGLRFVTPPAAGQSFPMTAGKDQLKALILRGDFR